MAIEKEVALVRVEILSILVCAAVTCTFALYVATKINTPIFMKSKTKKVSCNLVDLSTFSIGLVSLHHLQPVGGLKMYRIFYA